MHVARGVDDNIIVKGLAVSTGAPTTRGKFYLLIRRFIGKAKHYPQILSGPRKDHRFGQTLIHAVIGSHRESTGITAFYIATKAAGG